ncbi:glutamate 5-kinase [Alkalihalobacillus sp. LMS39]|uniref:glutamate 5-kinase n=1 Tax=Alkalihalobacillus sp. LMS39 TaxID=2924032 RepID=UPI001FB538AB|nr:glutamate 5-kinase [Alkalihalobacillus sp. LMS39]UOE96028.1 glutamate 5-kinase [Alkalihalobacillus sp. LMS39]
MTKQRIVVKIGSSSLTTGTGKLSKEKVTEHVAAIAALKRAGHDVILISSGAVAAGFSDLGYPSRPVTIAGKQAAAAVGQSLLMQGYAEECKKHDLVTAQLLLTRHNFANNEQYHNAYSTLTELLKRNVLPIINENDSVSIEELTFGDNDMLSALVSGLVHANFLVILTDINGLYDANPHKNPQAKKFTFLPAVSEELMKVAGGSGSKVGTGGMRSKIEAAKTALSLGVKVFIGTGEGSQKLLDIVDGKGDGTYIGYAVHTSITNKKQWLAFHSDVSGQIMIDDGAVIAVIKNGKSLLPAGVKSVTGTFSAGQVVEVTNEKGELIGKGQIDISSSDLSLIKGLSSEQANKQINRDRSEVIHRDNWVTLTKEKMIK